MSSYCACRTNTFRTFIRSVTQIQLPNEPLTRAPWQDPRRHIHNHMGTRWPAASDSPHRRIHTDADQSPPTQDEASTSARVQAEDSSNTRSARPVVTELYSDSDELPEVPAPREGTVTDHKARLGDRPRFKSPRKHSSSREGRATTSRGGPRPSGLSSEAKAARLAAIQEEKALARKEYEERHAKKLSDKKRERDRKESMPMWGLQKEALQAKFPEGWQPRKRLSPDAIAGIKELHKQFPDLYTTTALAQKFEVSPEAIRRILKAKWEPTAEEEEARQERWFRRGTAVWSRWAELGLKPPKKWRDEGIQRSAPRRNYEPPQQEEKAPWAAEDIDPEKARRLRVQSRIAQNLV